MYMQESGREYGACAQVCGSDEIRAPAVCLSERAIVLLDDAVGGGGKNEKKICRHSGAVQRARSGVCVISVLERPICAVNLFSVEVVCVVFCGVWWYPVRWALFFGLVVHREKEKKRSETVRESVTYGREEEERVVVFEWVSV